MIKKYVCLALTVSLATIPLCSTPFSLKRKPANVSFAIEDYVLLSVGLVGGAAGIYNVIKPGHLKCRFQDGSVEYVKRENTQTDYMYTLINSISLVKIVSMSNEALQRKYALYRWNKRTNKEVYDDARATYNWVLEKTITDPDLAHIFRARTLQEQRTIIEITSFDNNLNLLNYLEHHHLVLKDHYTALSTQLNNEKNSNNLLIGTNLQKNMHQELDKLILAIASLA
ncbi:hypothetical protein H0X48_06255 [Candidatus Dependentiae bacterium]|nr:hypothetical protein [Candidatus Dependentiae bacterium]